MRENQPGKIYSKWRFLKFYLFTLLFSIFMSNGLLNSAQADAAVAFNAASESHTGITGSTGQASFTWSHAGTASTRGVVVFVYTISATDHITSVTYGGTTMARVAGGAAIDTAVEPGRIDTFFLGTSVPTGAQSVVVNRTNNATVMYAVAMSVTAATNTEPTGIILLQEDGTFSVQSVNDGSTGSNSLRFAAGYTGATTPVPAGTGSTLGASIDFGSYGASAVYETAAGQGARNIGFNYATSDDRAAVHLAVREIANATLTITTAGAGSGTVYSSPGTIACATGSSTNCSDTFANPTDVTLNAAPDWKSEVVWSGGCTATPGSNTCGPFTLTGNTGVTATFNYKQLVMMPGPEYYATIQDAYNSCGDGTVIQGRDQTFTEDLLFDRSVNVTFNGGNDATWNVVGNTTINGTVTMAGVAGGGATISNLIIQ